MGSIAQEGNEGAYHDHSGQVPIILYSLSSPFSLRSQFIVQTYFFFLPVMFMADLYAYCDHHDDHDQADDDTT